MAMNVDQDKWLRMFRHRAKQAACKARSLMLAIERDEDRNPVTLEGAVRSMLLKSPDMFGYRDDALSVLYCVLGSGIEWNEHGRLGDTSPNNYVNLPPDIHYGPWSREFGFKESMASCTASLPVDVKQRIMQDQRERMDRGLGDAIAVISDIDSRCQTYRPDRKSWYPISWYACHLCVPAHVQQDFLDGAIEIAALIANWDVPYNANHYDALLRTVRFAEAILPILVERNKHRSELKEAASK